MAEEPGREGLDLDHYLALLGKVDDEELAAGFRERRDALLPQIFETMEEYFEPANAGDTRAVVEWRILGGADGRHDTYHMLIADRRCRSFPGPAEGATVTITIGPVPFLRMITGQANPIRLFTFGKLSVAGDLILAARVSSFFRLPSPA